jgi:hypothetical protein
MWSGGPSTVYAIPGSRTNFALWVRQSEASNNDCPDMFPRPDGSEDLSAGCNRRIFGFWSYLTLEFCRVFN